MGAEPADDGSGFIANGQSARKEPAIAAIPTAHGERILPWLAAFETLPDALDHTIDMIGMVDLLPAPALHLFKGRPGEVVPALVVPIDRAGFVCGPGELADVVGKLVEAELAFAQRCFTGIQHGLRTLAFGDVFGDDVDPDNGPVRTLQGR